MMSRRVAEDDGPEVFYKSNPMNFRNKRNHINNSFLERSNYTRKIVLEHYKHQKSQCPNNHGKKEPSKSSGPRALSELREKTTFLISSLEGHLTSIEFLSLKKKKLQAYRQQSYIP